jgi:uncharacterized membrane protein YkvA (DUF1232 family)
MNARPLLAIFIVLALLYLVFVVSLYINGKQSRAREIAGFIPDTIILFKNLLKDEAVPKKYKWLLGVLIVYLAFPFDIVPDFIPIAGQLDDVIIVAFGLRLLLRASGPAVIKKNWQGPKRPLNALLKIANVY